MQQLLKMLGDVVVEEVHRFYKWVTQWIAIITLEAITVPTTTEPKHINLL